MRDPAPAALPGSLPATPSPELRDGPGRPAASGYAPLPVRRETRAVVNDDLGVGVSGKDSRGAATGDGSRTVT